MSNIAKNLRILRLQADKKQNEIASYLGITQQEYSKFERNHLKPKIEYLEQLARFYNVTIDFLISNSAQTPDALKTLNPHERDLYDKLLESMGAQIKVLEALKSLRGKS